MHQELGLTEVIHHHWSRQFEYPWVLLNGDFKPNDHVMDIGGGASDFCCKVAEKVSRVVCADIDPEWTPENAPENVWFERADVRDMYGFGDASFDKVMCISVIEHVESPLLGFDEMWRVLKPGGKLLITMDVASYARWNHVFDQTETRRLMERFGQELPKDPLGILTRYFDDHDRTSEYEAKGTLLRVLCFCCEKVE